MTEEPAQYKVGPNPRMLARTLRVNVLLGGLLALMTLASWQLIVSLQTQQQLSQDRSELRHVRYGMLNADIWVQQVSGIVEQKILEMQIQGEERAALKRALERILDTLLTAADQQMRLHHSSGDWWDRTTGRIKESMRNTLMDIDTIKVGIPDYAEEILVELEKPATRAELSEFMAGMLAEITRETFGQVDETLRDAVRERYHCNGTTNECKAIIGQRLDQQQQRARLLAALALLCSLLMLLLVAHSRVADNPLQWVLLSGGAMVLLACGVLTPMIEVEAQITNLKFMLMGQPVEFFNEVLYFQSKSILDVVAVLQETGKLNMLLVAVLLVTFSIVFPLLKLFASIIYSYDLRGWRHHALVEFFALKSAKWSMADVMVIAIMMAYIGFNGMISSQLDLITQGAAGAGLSVLSTNGTELKPGFFMFLAFCLYSLVVSTLMDRQGQTQTSPGSLD